MVVHDEIAAFISKRSKIHLRELSPSTKIYKSGLISSLSMLDLLCHLEQKFEIIIKPEELTGDNFEDIGTLSSFIEKKIQVFQGRV
jgi:acyl carrier protein